MQKKVHRIRKFQNLRPSSSLPHAYRLLSSAPASPFSTPSLYTHTSFIMAEEVYDGAIGIDLGKLRSQMLHSAALCYGFAVGRIFCADQNLR